MYYRAAQAAIVVYDIRRQVCADGTLRCAVGGALTTGLAGVAR